MKKLLNDIEVFFEIIAVLIVFSWMIGGFGWVLVGMAFEDYPLLGWIMLCINSIIWILIIIHRYVHRLEIFETTKKEFRDNV